MKARTLLLQSKRDHRSQKLGGRSFILILNHNVCLCMNFVKYRCLYLARCYPPVKRYAEALTLVQHANIHLRETRTVLSTSDSDPITSRTPSYYPLTNTDFDGLEGDLSADGLLFKRDWFAYNGGSVDADYKSHKKPLFFDIALNYVQLDMDRLQERAGKKPVVKSTDAKAEPKQIARAKVEEEARPLTPEPQATPSGGLSSLLGGWWGRK
jgi:signal recognition particle subunit SRP68